MIIAYNTSDDSPLGVKSSAGIKADIFRKFNPYMLRKCCKNDRMDYLDLAKCKKCIGKKVWKLVWQATSVCPERHEIY